MKLKANQQAPDFSVLDIHKKSLHLNELKGQKILLCFYRYAGCPFCNRSLHQLIELHTHYEKKNLKIIIFFQSSTENIAHYHKDMKFPFSVVADPFKAVYKQYGIESSAKKTFKTALKIDLYIDMLLKGNFKQGKVNGDLLLIPAQFLIDEKGKIVKAYYVDNLTDTLSLDTVEEFIS